MQIIIFNCKKMYAFGIKDKIKDNQNLNDLNDSLEYYFIDKDEFTEDFKLYAINEDLLGEEIVYEQPKKDLNEEKLSDFKLNEVDFDFFVNNPPKNIPKIEKDNNISKERTKFQTQLINQTEIDLNSLAKPKNEKIFNIMKEKNKKNDMGRIKKESKNKIYGLHDKYSEDNIIRRIKASFLEKNMNLLNKEYNGHLNSNKIKKKVRLIRRILPTESRKIKKEENIKFFNSKLKEIYSTPISTKYSKYGSDYNIRKIDELYKENKAKNVINILEKQISEMYYIYSNDIKVDGFETLEDDLRNLEFEWREEEIEMTPEKEKDMKSYLNKYKYIAQNLMKIFDNKKSRCRKQSKNNVSNGH